MVVNSCESVLVGQEAGVPSPATLGSCSAGPPGGKGCPEPGDSPGMSCVTLLPRCLHGEKLGIVSAQHQRAGSVLQLSILAPTLDREPEEEQVRWG